MFGRHSPDIAEASPSSGITSAPHADGIT